MCASQVGFERHPAASSSVLAAQPAVNLLADPNYPAMGVLVSMQQMVDDEELIHHFAAPEVSMFDS